MARDVYLGWGECHKNGTAMWPPRKVVRFDFTPIGSLYQSDDFDAAT